MSLVDMNDQRDMSESHWVWFPEMGIDSDGRENEKAVAIATMLWDWGYPENGSLLLRVVEQKRHCIQLVWSHHANPQQPTSTLVFQGEKYLCLT